MFPNFTVMRRSCRCADRMVAFSIAASLTLTPGIRTAAQGVQTAQNNSQLPQINVAAARKKQARAHKRGSTATAVTRGSAPSRVGTPTNPLAGTAMTPLNAPAPSSTPTNPLAGTAMTPLDAPAASSTRLGLPVLETPASVDIVTKQTIQDQGYRTTAEIAKGAVGVLDLDSSGAPANFSMRGFTFGAVNVLYNGISIGVASDTTRVMGTANLYQVEFLKGPSALMSGIMAVGGSVNYVSKQPTTGPIQNELDLSLDSLGTALSHYGSGGSTAVAGLDYRFDVIGSRIGSFVDGDYRDLGDVSAQLNYRVNDMIKTFAAFEYNHDSGHAYWGTPVVPTSFAGANAVNGVVSGNAFSTFSGDNLGLVTIDRRTINTNYNVLDNSTGADELWLRSGFEWTPLNNITVKDQAYYYQAARHWFDSETYAFDDGAVFAPNTIDRDRFFVTHNQHVVGNNLDFLWDTRLFGMDNRLAAQLQVSGNWITFTQEGNPNDYPYDNVAVIDPVPGRLRPAVSGCPE